MLKRHVGSVLLLGSLLASPGLAQTPDRVDFGRDVLPLLRQNCIGCHGPTKQMNAFRLDRRSTAFRGGTLTVLIPGSSASSRLYRRIIGNEFGNQMPPTGPLAPEQVAVIKAWIDQGADWPDAYANEDDPPPADARAVRLIDAFRVADSATVQRMIAADPRVLNARGPDGTTPFMAATLYSDAAALKVLLDQGADPNGKNDAKATALMWAVDDLAKTRLLVERGAQVNITSSDGRSPLFIAATQARSAPVVKFLLEHGADPNPAARSNADSTPLAQAAIVGDAEVMQLLIDHGADIPASGALALSFSVLMQCSKCFELIAGKMSVPALNGAFLNSAIAGNVEAARFMLDHGANINARDPQGRTALIYAASSDWLPLGAVKFLVEKGADLNAKTVDGRTALHYAKLHGNTPIAELLTKAGARDEGPAAEKALKTVARNTPEAAIRRSLPILQKADTNFSRKSGCISCHNDSLTAMTVSAARRNSLPVDEPLAAQQVNANMAYVREYRERLLQGIAPGNFAGPNILSYILVGLQAENYKADFTTDVVAHFVRSRQQSDGHWALPDFSSRPPLTATSVTATALSLRALQAYAPVPAKKEYESAVALAGKWLVTAPVYSNDDRAFRLMGLFWSRQEKPAIQKAILDLKSTQRPDGGWSTIPSIESEAYSTGQALVALHEAGVPVSDPAYQKGVQFLLKTQLEDGSWYVQTRSVPIQPYFDNGFPHGIDQWISAAATNWSTMALSFVAKSKSTSAEGAGKKR